MLSVWVFVFLDLNLDDMWFLVNLCVFFGGIYFFLFWLYGYWGWHYWGCFVLEMLSCLGFVCVCVDDGNLSNVRDSRCRFPCWLVMRFIVWFGGTSIFFLLICFFIFLSSVLYMCFNGWIGLDWLCATFLTGLHLENRVLGEI